jgi:hypothetical protein
VDGDDVAYTRSCGDLAFFAYHCRFTGASVVGYFENGTELNH